MVPDEPYNATNARIIRRTGGALLDDDDGLDDDDDDDDDEVVEEEEDDDPLEDGDTGAERGTLLTVTRNNGSLA